jgi:hypothetical protein
MTKELIFKGQEELLLFLSKNDIIMMNLPESTEQRLASA